MSSNKRKKFVYSDYFIIEAKENSKDKVATCKLCELGKDGLGKKLLMKNRGTSSLIRHLEGVHKMTNKNDELEIENEADEVEQRPLDFDDETVDFICVKKLPFNFFDDQHSQDYFNYLNSSHNYPKRTALTNKVLKRYGDLSTALKKSLSKLSSKVAITTDGWTSRARKGFYGVTIHFIDDEWVLRSLPLDFIAGHGQHAGNAIASLIYQTLHDANLKVKFQAAVTDNASNNTTFIQYLAEKLKVDGIEFSSEDGQFKCFAHIMNLGVQDIMKYVDPKDQKSKNKSVKATPPSNKNNDDNELLPLLDDYEFDYNDSDSDIEENPNSDEIPNSNNSAASSSSSSTSSSSPEVADLSPNVAVRKVRNLQITILNSESLTISLETECQNQGLKFNKPKYDSPTRWHSTYQMISGALRMKGALINMAQTFVPLQDYALSAQEWDVLETISTYLACFNDLSEEICGDYVTLPLVVIGFNMLLDWLETLILPEKDESGSLKTMTNVETIMKEALLKGRDKMLKHYKKMNWVYSAALILDPRHKVVTFDKTTWGRELKEGSNNKFQELYKNYNTTPTPVLTTPSSTSPSASTSSQPVTTPKKIRNINSRSLFVEDEEDDLHHFSTKDEFAEYVVEPRQPKNTDILKYWSSREQKWPKLAAMAKDVLAIPATSVPCERLFSSAGDVIRPNRCNLGSNTARAQICIGEWRKSDYYKKIIKEL